MLVEQINKDLIDAMKAKDEVKLRAIRAIKSAFLLAGTETGSKDINDETAIKAMQKMAKQRKDSIDIFLKENRQDLAKKEQEELVVIEQYLPPSMSEQDLIAALKDLLENPSKQAQIKEDYAALQKALYTGQNAAEVSAGIILEELSN